MLRCSVPVLWAGKLRNNWREMRKSIFAFMLAAVSCGCLISCNGNDQSNKEEPKKLIYRMVTVMPDGRELSDRIEAENDTVAAKQFVDKMTKLVAGNQQPDYEALYLISPDGDTLNTNLDLMEAAMNPVVLPAPVEEPTK